MFALADPDPRQKIPCVMLGGVSSPSVSVREAPGGLEGVAVLIPAWHPEPALLTLAARLRAAGIGLLLVVDDGSPAEFATIFEELQRDGVSVLRHAVNCGKGRALKTGFNFLLTEHPELTGVITADADGQHSAEDILRVAAALGTAKGRPVLGVRAFAGSVPLRSRFGNTLTRTIFAFVTGVKIGDTQTGLRGLPLAVLPELITLDGEHYEFEMTVLAHLCRHGRGPVTVPIETIYIENNRSSHFDPVWDSMRIYFVLARFVLSSIVASVVDFIGFTLAFATTGNLAIAVGTGRLSSLLNFAMNRRFVFRVRGSVLPALVRYYALVVCIALLSLALLRFTVHHLHWNVYLAKLCVDAPLSIVSFSVQRTFIFRRTEPV